MTRSAKFTKNKNDQWSSAARVSVSKCTNPWYMTHSVLPFTIREPRQVCLNCAGLWLWVAWAFPDSPNTTGWPPGVFQGLAPIDQLSKSRTETNLQAKYRTPQMPLAARRWFSKGSKSRSQKTSQCVQVMFKAKKHIYKKHGFSKFDHTTMRKKTHQNKLDGWKHDGWALAKTLQQKLIPKSIRCSVQQLCICGQRRCPSKILGFGPGSWHFLQIEKK